VPSTVWNAKQLANFSSGLFGPIDTSHGRPAGYFDPLDPAGFFINEYGVGELGDISGQIDTLTATITLGSDYADLPAGALATANQFGPWLPDTMLPYGIFFDDDNNPETDAELIAWYGYNPDPAVAALGWMKGAADDFSEVLPTAIETQGENLAYTMGLIDDLVNVGLNYVVTVGDISSFPGYDADPALNIATFTIRVTPTKDTSGTGAPAYFDTVNDETFLPVPSLKFVSHDGVVAIDPSPNFNIGDLLTARVGDAGLNKFSDLIETVDVTISSTVGGLSETLTLIEQGEDRGVFAASLPEEYSDLAVGVVAIVTVSYIDGDIDGTGTLPPALKEASTSTEVALPAGTLQFNPIAYSVEENTGTIDVLVTRTDGSAGDVAVEYQTVSGTAIGGEDYVTDTGSVAFTDLDADTKTITVAIINNDAAEPTKEFTLLLSNVQGGATLGAEDTATVTLTDTDIAPAGSLQFNPVDYSVAGNDGTITLTVERIDGVAGEATVEFLTLAGTALGSEDYVVQTGTLTFTDGSEASQSITVEILNDETFDGDEVFTIQLSNATVADIGGADIATVTIIDTTEVAPTKGDGIFGFGWITTGLVLIGLLGRVRRKTS
ncbi:MAG: choice-of-anchor F family protein, partial [Gammaproteobacteria bacterium]|nr:choice-of-anchor F family protein [Gammaproteobacteria bacterium]